MTQPTSPYLARFLSDFTLGFSDGLTVPFALTAGLGSLGHTDTVIYAGLAELCAGSISMGIGGYLSARDEVPPPPGARDGDDLSPDSDGEEQDEERRGMLRGQESSGAEKGHGRADAEEGEDKDAIRSHLEPLGLSDSALLHVLASLKSCPDGIRRAALRVRPRGGGGNSSVTATPAIIHHLPTWPVVSGLSISLGYAIGGAIPLFPYLFAPTVRAGLRWSIAVCLVALVAFGVTKSWVLRGEQRSLRRSLWEGAQMLVLGGLAAGAAVLCVTLLGRSPGLDP